VTTDLTTDLIAIRQIILRFGNGNVDRRLVAFFRIFHSRLIRKKITVLRTERVSVLKGIRIDANAVAIMTVIGPWNEIIIHYPAFLLEATAAMPRKSEAYVDRWD
jgi:hypothetical protein